ncbi:MAG: hypothetical protein WD042_06515 [Phycisphaeraceae bacterium]
MTRPISILTLAAVVTCLCACTSKSPTTPAPMQGPTIWHNPVPDAYGGLKRWNAVRFFRFDLVVRDGDGKELHRARHLWDKRTGDYRYEADAGAFAALPFADEEMHIWRPIDLELPPGALVALVNRATGEGRIYIDGQEQPATLVPRVLQRIDHDSFWLLLPFQTQGANLEGQIDRARGDKVLKLQYPVRPGQQGQDAWLLQLARDSWRITRTQLHPRNSYRHVIAEWSGEKKVGGLTFATIRKLDDGSLTFEHIALPRRVAGNVFTDVATPLP